MFRKKEGLLIAGLFCIFTAMIMKYCFNGAGIIDFFEGVFIGLSFVFNISYLIKIRLDGLI